MQISLFPSTKDKRLKRSQEFTLQIVNKSPIYIYTHRYLTLKLDLRNNFTHFIIIVEVKRPYWVPNVFINMSFILMNTNV